jgi:hypothetical protein
VVGKKRKIGLGKNFGLETFLFNFNIFLEANNNYNTVCFVLQKHIWCLDDKN